jgi:hydrogenase maturation protease
MIHIIGLGNPLRGDDGIGPAVLEQLATGMKVPGCELVMAGSDAFTVLEHLVSGERMIIVDCARMGSEPGTVARFDISAVNLYQADNAVSLHGFRFAEIYAMARSMGVNPDCTVIGVEPEQVVFNEDLSATVRASIPAVIKMIIEEIDSHGPEDTYH